MKDLLGVLLVLAAFVGLIGLAWLVAWKLGLLKPGAGGAGGAGDAGAAGATRREPTPGPSLGEGDEPGQREYRYRAQLAVLSDGERAFWPALRAALPILTKLAGASEAPLLLAHVRLADVVVPEPFSRGAFAVVSQKHVDFLLCEPVSTRPLLVIELDGATHGGAGSGRQKERDAAKDAACASAGVPVLRVPVAGSYSPEALARAMAERMGKGGARADSRE